MKRKVFIYFLSAFLLFAIFGGIQKITSFQYNPLGALIAGILPSWQKTQPPIPSEEIPETSFSQEENTNPGADQDDDALVEKIDDLEDQVDVLSQRINEMEKQLQLLNEENLMAQEEDTEDEGLNEEEVGQDVGQEPCEKIQGVQPVKNKIIFDEIAWMGTSASSSAEWIELKNVSGNPLDLSGWQILSKENEIKVIFDRGRASINELLLLERGSDNSVPGVTADLVYNGALKNENEALSLFNENCQLQDEVIAGPDWPGGDNSSKRTMERKSDFAWQASFNPGGTPKAENSSGYVVVTPPGGGGGGGGTPPPVVYPKILITEVRISPLAERFVEFYNPNSEVVNLTGWYIHRKVGDGTPSTFISSPNFEGKTIGSFGYFLITHSSSTAAAGADILLQLTLTLNNTLLLKNPKGEITDEINWGDVPEGFSYGRIWDDSTDTYSDNFEIQEPTPKEKNKSPVLPQDIIPPQVAFNDISPLQTTLLFVISWTGEDFAPAGVEPSGIDGYQLRYSDDKENWDYWPSENEYSLETETEYNFTGEDEKTYYFQLKAKDKAGNESDWLPEPPVFTEINLPKIVLINEIQIASASSVDDEFIELYNPNSQDINLEGWSLKKKTASGNESNLVSSGKFLGIISAGSYFLIVPQDGYQGKEAPDLFYSGKDYSMSENNTVLLYNNKGNLVDKIGFGSAKDFEGSAFPQNPEKDQSLGRKWIEGQGYQDTDDNSTDFEIQEPTTRSINNP